MKASIPNYLSAHPRANTCSRCSTTVPTRGLASASLCWKCTYELASQPATIQAALTPTTCPCGNPLPPKHRLCQACSRKARLKALKLQNRRKRHFVH